MALYNQNYAFDFWTKIEKNGHSVLSVQLHSAVYPSGRQAKNCSIFGGIFKRPLFCLDWKAYNKNSISCSFKSIYVQDKHFKLDFFKKGQNFLKIWAYIKTFFTYPKFAIVNRLMIRYYFGPRSYHIKISKRYEKLLLYGFL